MTTLRVYRMLKELDKINAISEDLNIEYNIAASFDCCALLSDAFFEERSSFEERWEELVNALYANRKMRRIAEILNDEIAEMFADWDKFTDEEIELPFM